MRRHLQLLTLPLLALALALAATTFGPATPAEAAVVVRAKKASRVAVHQIGDPYRYGANGPRAFDCSGLVQYSFKRAGFRKIPRTSSGQARYAKRIKRSKMRRGDLIFFHHGGRVYHVAVFLGRKHGKVRMVHAPSSGRRVSRATPWTNSWFAGRVRG